MNWPIRPIYYRKNDSLSYSPRMRIRHAGHPYKYLNCATCTLPTNSFPAGVSEISFETGSCKANTAANWSQRHVLALLDSDTVSPRVMHDAQLYQAQSASPRLRASFNCDNPFCSYIFSLTRHSLEILGPFSLL